MRKRPLRKGGAPKSTGLLGHRATRSEIRIRSTVPVAQLQKTVDQMSRELRLLDNQIQQTNWTTEL